MANPHVAVTSSMMKKKVGEKDTDLGSLKRALVVLKFSSRFCPPFMENRLTCAVNMGWERILPLKIYSISKLGNKLRFIYFC
jgi:hypothetical protein